MMSDPPVFQRKFSLGHIMATVSALRAIPKIEMLAALDRHVQGDWGEQSVASWNANDYAMRRGGSLFSVYRSRTGIAFWIITEPDRLLTTVLLPENSGSMPWVRMDRVSSLYEFGGGYSEGSEGHNSVHQ